MLGDIRAFFAERDVIEVQTPTLGRTSTTEPQIEPLRTADGAFLQTSPEHYMKRLLAAGAPSIYQLGPAYRAGEKGRLHQEEFSMLEWYRLGFDDAALMDEVAALVDRILGPQECRRLSYEALVGAPTGDAAELDLRLANSVAIKCLSEDDPEDVAELDLRFANSLAGLGKGRWFVTDYPAEQAALARLQAGNETRAARFELIVDGLELANGYHELTDPAELQRRMARDNAVRAAADCPQMAADDRLLAAMAHGLPDSAGVALGVDRLLMLALGASSLAEVMPFADR